nr:ribonuclease H-like domain-containing protein [Tanacetum cinerariifolium]
MADEITLESLTEEQFACFIEYYHTNFPEDFHSNLKNIKETYRMMNGGAEYPNIHSTSSSETYAPYEPSPMIDPFEHPPCLGSSIFSKALGKSNQVNQNLMENSLALKDKFAELIESLNPLPMEINEEYLAKHNEKDSYELYHKFEMAKKGFKIPRFMFGLDSNDKHIGDLDMMEDEAKNPSPQSTSQVLPSFEVYTPPVTYPKEVDETIGIPMKVEPLDHIKLEDLGLNTCSHDLFLSSR